MTLYADTDFFIALLKDSDWLKEDSVAIFNKNKGNIVTSINAFTELMILSKTKGLDPILITGSLFDMVDVEGISRTDAMRVAHLIKHENVGTFDAFHAVLASDRPIISSGSIYDRLGLERVKIHG